LKKAVLLHGTSGSPESNWLPWLKTQLTYRNYRVWVPNLPGNEMPNWQVYNDFLLDSDWDFTDNLVIGHSSGAVAVLNLLQDNRCPRIEAGVLVSPWTDTAKANLDHDGLTRERFKNLFPPSGFNFELLKQKADDFLILHGDNDPYCPLDQARWLATRTNAELTIITNGGHLNRNSGFSELPQLVSLLETRSLL